MGSKRNTSSAASSLASGLAHPAGTRERERERETEAESACTHAQSPHACDMLHVQPTLAAESAGPRALRDPEGAGHGAPPVALHVPIMKYVLKGSWDLVTRVITKVTILIITYNPS